MIRSSLTLLVASSMLLFSCKKKNDDPTPNGQPNNSNTSRPAFLEEGTEYEFDYVSFMDEASVRSLIFKEVAKDTFELRNYTEADTYPAKLYIVWNNGSIYSSARLRDQASYQKICDFAAAVGTSWKARNGTYTVEAHNTTIKTLFGTLNDVTKIKYVSTGATEGSYEYYSLKYGMVGQGYESSDELATKIDLKSVKMGVKNASPSASVPAITFGSLPFLKVGAEWKYNAEVGLTGEEDIFTILIKSKLANANIYEVTLNFKNEDETTTQYWYEDAGKLMVYDAGESPKQADVLYDKLASKGDGWIGMDGQTTFFYKVKETAYNFTSDLYPSGIKTTNIYVTSGLFSNQTNYWNENRGQVSADGFAIYLDLFATKNLRKEHKAHPVALYGGL